MAFAPISLDNSGSLCEPCSPPEPGKHLYLDDPRVVELPECGCITFRFKRGPVTIKEGGSGREASASADLTLTEICAVKEEASGDVEEYEKSDKVENQIDKLFEELRGKEEAEEEKE
jgi:hypothetical protein